MNNIEFKLDFSNKSIVYFKPDALKSAIEKYKTDFIDKGRSIGTMHVPDDISKTTIVSLEHASHIIDELKLEENGDISGKLHVLDTPTGKSLKDIFNAKLIPEYSMAFTAENNKIKEIIQIAVVGIKD